MSELISIVIPVYNAEKYIKECVCSVLNQSYANLELILINDGSKDNSLEIIKTLSNEDSRIKIIDIDNNGVSNARNQGIFLASGKYIVFIDADDYITPDYISYMYNLTEVTKAQMVISTNYFNDENEKNVNNETIKTWSAEECTTNLLYPKVTVGCWNKMYDLDFIKNSRIKFRDDLFFGEGLKFITDVSQRVNKVGVGNRKVYTYRKNAESCTAVHDVSKAKASFNSLNAIRDDLKINSINVNKALNCHYWLNHFLAIRFMKLEKLNKEEIIYRNNSIKFLRKNISYILLSEARLKLKFASIVVALLPNFSANLFNKLKNQ
jgi:glycosyltransferase involved in cell wall biosynthesis